MKSLLTVATLSVCVWQSFGAPLAKNEHPKRQTITIPATSSMPGGEILTFEIDPSVLVSSPSGSGTSGDAAVSATFDAKVAGPTGVTGEISGDGDAHASLDPGNRGASTTLLGAIGPSGTLTGAESQSSNTGGGSAGAGGNINANSGAAHSTAGTGTGADQNGAGGGSGGGSDAFGTGAGGGSGANVSGNNNNVVSGAVTGADANGAFFAALTKALSQHGWAFSGTGSGADYWGNLFSGSIAGTLGQGSTSGAGSGAGGPGSPGVDTGVNSP